MSLMKCSSCSTAFVVGLLRCPRCGALSSLFAGSGKQGENMPKITVAGASNAAEDAVVEQEPPVVSDAPADADVQAPEEVAAEPDQKSAPKAEADAAPADDDTAEVPTPTPAKKTATPRAAKKAAVSKP